MWIGLYSDNQGVTWHYTDGTPFDYVWWYSDYPHRNGHLCANFFDNGSNNGLLRNNMECSTAMYGVCKQPAFQY